MTKHNPELEDLEDQMIETVDEEGNIINFQVIDFIETDGKEYALLLPQENDDSEEDKEVVLMRLTKEGDEYSFEMIEDDDEFNRVLDYINTLDDIDEVEIVEEYVWQLYFLSILYIYTRIKIRDEKIYHTRGITQCLRPKGLFFCFS